MSRIDDKELRDDIKPPDYVHHDWMNDGGIPMDARSSPYVETIGGVEHRVHPGYFRHGLMVKVPNVPTNPRLRKAHIEWKAKNIIDPTI